MHHDERAASDSPGTVESRLTWLGLWSADKGKGGTGSFGAAAHAYTLSKRKGAINCEPPDRDTCVLECS